MSRAHQLSSFVLVSGEGAIPTLVTTAVDGGVKGEERLQLER